MAELSFDAEWFHGEMDKQQAEARLASAPEAAWFVRQVDQGLVLSFKYKGKATSHLLARDRYTRLWTINNKDYGIAAGTLSEFVTALQSPVKGWPRPLGQVIPRDATTEAATAEAAAEAAGETATAVAEPLSSAAEPPAETHPAEPTAEFVLSDVGDAFYHGHISKDEVDARLLCDKNNTDGTFLVYARGTAADHYVLSVIYRSKPTHHLLEMRDGTLTVNGSETPATNLPELVEHLRRKHSHWPVPLGKHVVGQEPPAFAEPEATPVAATEGMKQTGTAAESGAAAASEETGASAEEPAPAAKEEETIAQPQAAHQAEEKELVPVAVPSETAPPAESTAATDIKPAVPVPATTSQPQDSISVDPTTDLPQGGVAGKRQIFAAATSAHVPTDQEIADLKPELPYPDFDPNERTVEPEMTQYFHGDLSQAEAEARLKGQSPGTFILSGQHDSIRPNFQLRLSMVKSDNSIGHYALTQKDAAGVLHIDGRPTGEFTVAGTIEYLQSRQPGWPEVLIQGLPGIKVMSSAEMEKMKAANAAAVAAVEQKKKEMIAAKLRAEAEARGVQTKLRTKQEMEEYEAQQREFARQREQQEKEWAARRREELKKKKLEERQRQLKERLRQRRDQQLQNDTKLIEVNLDSDDSSSSEDEEQVSAWRRRASATQFGFNNQGASVKKQPTLAEEADEEGKEPSESSAEVVGGSDDANKKRASVDRADKKKDKEKCVIQ